MILFKDINKIALVLSGLLLWNCSSNTKEQSDFNGRCIADPIIYEVVVSNPDTDDAWKQECLANTNTEQMVKEIIGAVKNGDIKAYDYYDNHQLTKIELHNLIEKEKIQEKVGKVQFTERWYWNSNTFKLQKKVEKLMLGYEIYDDNGKVKGYKASFFVKLGN